MTKRIDDPIQPEGIGSVAVRLEQLIGEESLRQFAKRTEVTEGALRKILKGSIPNLETAFKIASACGVSIDWLATGKESSRDGKVAEATPAKPSPINPVEVFEEEFCLVPGFHIQVSAGNGCDAFDQEPKRWLAFRKKYLKFKRLNPERCAVVFVRGDSMADTITDNDSLLVDRDSTTPIDGKIYVVRLGDELYAKRIQKSYDGSLTLISDNKDYAPIEVPKDKLDQLCIVGRVVQRATDI
ncbi:helix-turn-helix transcriptional regulator [Vibrio navarrensis]|nr:helix-turn-helix transcriptional regulator [Vibrio navarrensis]